METCTSIYGQLQHPTLLVSECDGDAFVGQDFIFLVAGFDTSGSTISYALYELALHPEIQNRLRAEIILVLNKHNGQLIYDGIQEMAYLDMFVSGARFEASDIRYFLISAKNSCMSTCVLILQYYVRWSMI